MNIMASFNRVILMGNLTRDPELRVTPQGTSVCKINVAVNKQIRMSDGGVKDETSFIDVDAFGRQADIIAKYFIKGRPILVEGRLKLDRWETQAGEKRSKLGVILESFQFVGQRTEDDYSQPAGVTDQRQEVVSELVEDLSVKRSGGSRHVDPDVSMDEDIPF